MQIKAKSLAAMGALVAAGMATALGVAALAAPAASADPTCSSAEFCVWGQHYYGSDSEAFTTEGNYDNWPNYIENKDSSLKNRGTTGKGVTVFRYHDQTTAIYCAPRGVAWPDLNPEDLGSSHYWTGC